MIDWYEVIFWICMTILVSILLISLSLIGYAFVGNICDNGIKAEVEAHTVDYDVGQIVYVAKPLDKIPILE
jgi:hypothetical protein